MPYFDIGIPQGIFANLRFRRFLMFFLIFRVFGSMRTRLLCIVGELAGGGSMAVTVGVSDR